MASAEEIPWEDAAVHESSSPRIQTILSLAGLAAFTWFAADRARGEEPVTLANVASPVAISATEPLAAELSLARAARSMDTAALSWQKTHNCGTCHTNIIQLLARPALRSIAAEPKEVRAFFEEMVTSRWDDLGPRWDTEVVAVAAALAIHDRLTTGHLQPTTRKALDRMWTLQREDGGWDWINCGWPPMESDDHYGVTFAAIGVGMAPDDYAETKAAKKGLDGIRKYLKENPPPSLHHRAMILWASLYVNGLATDADLEQTLADLLKGQTPDGGWAIAGLLADWNEHSRKDKLPQVLDKGDGYATGLVVYLARKKGLAADDPRLARGIAWLKANQRESGRWFTPSPTKDGKNYITNAGTAMAVLALQEEGGIPNRPAVASSPSPSP
ncbi:MAG: squalene--hopene cyclase [Planctomycetota bacterium]